MSSAKKYEYTIPRSFKLRMELEIAEKGNAEQKQKDPHQGFVSFGIGQIEDRGYDLQLCNWNGTIIGPQNTPLGEKFYSLRIHCGANYPNEMPVVHFVEKINMEGVDQKTGLVSGVMKNWHRGLSIYDYLVVIRMAMVAASKLKQPRDGETY